jgi:pyrroline-5-carboxylate reductase
MSAPSIGFIGGGRVARILLGGWTRAGVLPARVLVSDSDEAALQRLAARHPSIGRTPPGDAAVAQQDVVFLALHPPVIAEALPAWRGTLRPDAILVSLAPKFTAARLSQLLGGFGRIARVIPNAPSIVNAGFNPVAFGAGLSASDRERVLALLKPLGECPVVEERLLEAYAIVSGMGPTYLWPQFEELRSLGVRFGLSEAQALDAVRAMVIGAAETLHRSGLAPGDVEDLIPVKPLADAMPTLLEAYRTKLVGLMEKIRPQ